MYKEQFEPWRPEELVFIKGVTIIKDTQELNTSLMYMERSVNAMMNNSQQRYKLRHYR